MRTIKFKGRTFNGTIWAYGLIEMLRFNDGTLHHYIREYKQNGGYTDYEVDPDTIGQFTGLHDKNGKEIYEGDIISLNPRNSRTLKVYWNDRMCNFLLVNDDTVIDMYKDDENHYKVIGNIYDNKELLTQN